MKYIRLKDLGLGWETKALMTLALSDAKQAGGADFEEVERRTRLIRELRLLPQDADTMVLEDADHKVLSHIMLKYKWATVSPELHEILGDVKNAGDEPPKTAHATASRANGHDAEAHA